MPSAYCASLENPSQKVFGTLASFLSQSSPQSWFVCHLKAEELLHELNRTELLHQPLKLFLLITHSPGGLQGVVSIETSLDQCSGIFQTIHCSCACLRFRVQRASGHPGQNEKLLQSKMM